MGCSLKCFEAVRRIHLWKILLHSKIFVIPQQQTVQSCMFTSVWYLTTQSQIQLVGKFALARFIAPTFNVVDIMGLAKLR